MLPAGALAVLVNVWTSGWAWAAGVGVAVVLLGQVAITWFLPPSGSGEASGISVRQRFGDVKDSAVTGIRADGAPTSPVVLDQGFKDVTGSKIVGVEIGDTGAARDKAEGE
ncbi:hypothetical protein AADW15_08075 [Saccharothrix sp. CCNWLY140-2]|uniref:hypothetical protein n=1 Tax=Saccharothrix sp. CCNWLY140-2 TaxID=3138500 RepID=UPI003097EC99